MRHKILMLGVKDENDSLSFFNAVELPFEPMDSKQFYYIIKKMADDAREYLKAIGNIE